VHGLGDNILASGDIVSIRVWEQTSIIRAKSATLITSLLTNRFSANTVHCTVSFNKPDRSKPQPMVLETISPQQRNRVHPKGRTMKICILKVSPTMKTTTTSWPKRTDKNWHERCSTERDMPSWTLMSMLYLASSPDGSNHACACKPAPATFENTNCIFLVQRKVSPFLSLNW